MSSIDTSVSSPINVALIGYGFVGKLFHAPLIRAVPGLNLKIVVSSDASKVNADLPEVTVVSSAQAAVDDPSIDLVVIATPNDTHAPLAELALKAGKHVVIDKPFTLDIQEARNLIQCAAQHDRLLSVFHNRRWDSDFLSIKQLIDDGKVGRVAHFESHIDRYRPLVRERWREQDLPGSGLWFDIGPHLIDQALQLFGLPLSVQGNIAKLRDNAKINDWAHVTLNYSKHKVILHCSMLVAGGSPRFIVHGTEGSLVKHKADNQENQLSAGLTPEDAQWGEDNDPVVYYAPETDPVIINSLKGDQSQYYHGIYKALSQQGENPVSSLQALAVMAVMEAAVVASDSGQTQQLPLTTEELAAWR